MKSSGNSICFLEQRSNLEKEALTGVSLHCHSLHSKEILDFVPYYASRIPAVSAIWRYKVNKYEREVGRQPNFNVGYWTPPLTGWEVFEHESRSIEELGLMPIVSITDHDSIAANHEVREEMPGEFAPISMEWTVPFGDAFFHVGVHNLPVETADAIAIELLNYTFAKGMPDNERLTELLAMLNEHEGVLVVLNHPIWDIEMIGQRRHEAALRDFLAVHGSWIHALEVNGFRSWSENSAVVALAKACGLPLVSGGDRHCCQSNTMINVTDAGSFAEFVDEVRNDGHSKIVVLPEYNTPLPTRQLRSMAQILGTFNEFPEGRRTWADRVFFDAEDGRGPQPLTLHWGGRTPAWTKFALMAVSALGHRWIEPLITLTVGDSDIGRNDETGMPPISFDGLELTRAAAFAEPKAMAASR